MLVEKTPVYNRVHQNTFAPSQTRYTSQHPRTPSCIRTTRLLTTNAHIYAQTNTHSGMPTPMQPHALCTIARTRTNTRTTHTSKHTHTHTHACTRARARANTCHAQADAHAHRMRTRTRACVATDVHMNTHRHNTRRHTRGQEIAQPQSLDNPRLARLMQDTYVTFFDGCCRKHACLHVLVCSDVPALLASHGTIQHTWHGGHAYLDGLMCALLLIFIHAGLQHFRPWRKNVTKKTLNPKSFRSGW